MNWLPFWIFVGFVPAVVGLSHCVAWTSQMAHNSRIEACSEGGGGWNLTDNKCEHAPNWGYPTKGDTE